MQSVDAHSNALLIIGGTLLVGYVAHVIGAKTHVPRVTLLLLIGVACGPAALNLVPEEAASWFPLVARCALAMVGFLLGEEFFGKAKLHSRMVLVLAASESLASALVVAGASLLFGLELPLALVLGGLAASTAPAATLDLMREARAHGPLTNAVKGTVASDDVLGVLIFSLALAAAQALRGVGHPSLELLHALWEIGGAVALGLVAGFPMAWLTGRLRQGEPAALEALGFVLLVAGAAAILEVSYLMACMTLGGTVALRAKHHTRAVHQIEGFSAPLLALFFFLAGFHLDVRALPALGATGVVYVGARTVGKLLGCRASAWLGVPQDVAHRAGWCLLPQAGVAIALALVASERLPVIGRIAMPVIVGGTVVFELVGPVAARWTLARAGELHVGASERSGQLETAEERNRLTR